jgi:hypothetical protein
MPLAFLLENASIDSTRGSLIKPRYPTKKQEKEEEEKQIVKRQHCFAFFSF